MTGKMIPYKTWAIDYKSNWSCWHYLDWEALGKELYPLGWFIVSQDPPLLPQTHRVALVPTLQGVLQMLNTHGSRPRQQQLQVLGGGQAGFVRCQRAPPLVRGAGGEKQVSS